jgi:hypothetical protein
MQRARDARETLEHLGGDARQPAVGHARNGILFMDQQRDAQQPGGDAARAADEAAGTEHRARPQPPQHAGGLHDGLQQSERRGEPGQQSLAAQATHAHPFHRDALRRDQPRFHAAGRAEPDDRHAARLQHAGDRERREHVAAGTTGHDQHGTCAHREPPVPRITAARDAQLTS